MSYPYIRHMTNMELNKGFMREKIALNIMQMAMDVKAKKQHNVKVLAFLDDKYVTAFDIAKLLLNPP